MKAVTTYCKGLLLAQDLQNQDENESSNTLRDDQAAQKSNLSKTNIYKAFCYHICPVIEYGSGVALTHLNRLDSFQACIENTCGSTSPPLASCPKASILGFTYCLLAGEGRGYLQSLCPKFRSRISCQLHNFDPCDFHALDCFHRSWQAAVVNLWDSIPTSILLQGKSKGWSTVLKRHSEVYYGSIM